MKLTPGDLTLLLRAWYVDKCLTALFHVDIHTEAVQAALAKYKERKVPLPSKRRSALVHSSVEACTPPGTVTSVGDSPQGAHMSDVFTAFPLAWDILCPVMETWKTGD